MRLTIDNLDGKGAVDYSGSLSSTPRVAVKRTLNAPSICSFSFLPSAKQLPMPARYAPVNLTDDSGALLFAGYVSSPPIITEAGLGFAGIVPQAEVTAVSDEILLDSTMTTQRFNGVSQTANQFLQTVSALSGAAGVRVSPTSTTALAGRYESSAGSTWSAATAGLSSSIRSSYRVENGVTQIQEVGSVVHTLREEDGSLQLSGLKASTVKLLANDVTVCGAVEPAAYATETFQGDGVTVKFTLTELPFEPVTRARVTLVDLFQTPALNPRMWQWTDSSSRLSITSQGLTCAGGSGRDGETTVSALEQVELGGSVVLEAGGVQVLSGSSGIILGLYFGVVSIPNCMAGFSVTSVGGVTQIAAIVEGNLAGSTLSIVNGRSYTFRTRLFCFEMERVGQSYYYLGAGGVGSQGGEYLLAGGRLVLEVQDVTNGVPGVPVALYDGAISTYPPSATIGLLNSGDLNCGIKTFSCKQEAPLWATLSQAGGTASTVHIGAPASGGVCSVNSAGLVTFYPSFIPPAGSLITILYRSRHRAVARRSSVEPEAPASPPSAMWIGSVRSPPAWSSLDCDNAALALLQSSASASAAWEGTYTALNLDDFWDVWPGDVLAINSSSAGIVADVVVREVQIHVGASYPQTFKYVVRFANDWAEDLAIHLSSTVPEDAWLPASPATIVPLANPAALTVGVITGSEIPIAANLTPPTGGGFEIKRADWAFGPGSDSDLVMRSPVPNFTIPRVAPVEQYFVRMYDGSVPPTYSRFSAAIFVNVPLSA